MIHRHETLRLILTNTVAMRTWHVYDERIERKKGDSARTIISFFCVLLWIIMISCDTIMNM
jgi:hypothetical protein